MFCVEQKKIFFSLSNFFEKKDSKRKKVCRMFSRRTESSMHRSWNIGWKLIGISVFRASFEEFIEFFFSFKNFVEKKIFEENKNFFFCSKIQKKLKESRKFFFVWSPISKKEGLETFSEFLRKQESRIVSKRKQSKAKISIKNFQKNVFFLTFSNEKIQKIFFSKFWNWSKRDKNFLKIFFSDVKIRKHEINFRNVWENKIFFVSERNFKPPFLFVFSKKRLCFSHLKRNIWKFFVQQI